MTFESAFVFDNIWKWEYVCLAVELERDFIISQPILTSAISQAWFKKSKFKNPNGF